MQATEFTENTEMMRVLRIFPDHRIGAGDIYGSRLFRLEAPTFGSSVNSVFSVANRFF
jgi:hypothetical protein